MLLLAAIVPRSAGANGPTFQETPRGIQIIVVASEPEARELVDRIANGASFGELAREVSIDPTGPDGGYLGAFRLSELRPDFRDALDAAGPGEVSDLVPVGSAYALLRTFTDDEQRWRELTDEGTRTYAQGRFPESRRLLRRAVEIAQEFGPDDRRLAQSLTNLATVSFQSGDYEAAERLYRQSLSVLERSRQADNPELVQPLTDLGVALYSLGRNLDEAEALLGRALAIVESNSAPVDAATATALNRLGLVRRARSDYAGARDVFSRSVMIVEQLYGSNHASLAPFLDELGEVERLAGNLAEAETYARRSLQIAEGAWGPDQPEVAPRLDRLARIHQDQGRYAEAVQLYERSLGIRWGVPGVSDRQQVVEALDAFTRILLNARIRDAASDLLFETYRSIITETRFEEDLYVAMANILLTVERPADAQWTIRQGVSTYPDSSQLQYELAETYVASQLYQEALEVLDEIEATTDPGRSFILGRTGDMLASLLRYDEAEDAFESALDADPLNLDALLSLGNLHFDQGQHERAREVFTLIVGEDPEHAEAFGRLAETDLVLARYEEAVPAAERALELDPSQVRSRYVRSMALRNLRLIEEAQTELAEYQQIQRDIQDGEEVERAIRAIERRVNAQVDTGAYDQAAAILRAAIDEYPDTLRMYLDLATVEGRIGDPRAMIDTLGAWLDQDGMEDFRVHAQLAEAYSALDLSELAVEHRAAYLDRIGRALEDEVE